MTSLTDLFYFCVKPLHTCADPEGGGGGGGVRTPPLEKSQNLEFPFNTGPDPLKNHKSTKSAFHVGPSSASQRNAI